MVGVGRVGDGETPLHERAELRRAVEQILEVRRRERQRVIRRVELGRHPPVASSRWLEPDGGRSPLEPHAPHQRGRHVQVRVRDVDPEIGPIDPVAEDFVGEPDSPVVPGHIPPGHLGPHRVELVPVPVECPYLEDVLRKLVAGIAPGRCRAHTHAERLGRQAADGDLDLHPPVLRFREAQLIQHRGAVGVVHPTLPAGAWPQEQHAKRHRRRHAGDATRNRHAGYRRCRGHAIAPDRPGAAPGNVFRVCLGQDTSHGLRAPG